MAGLDDATEIVYIKRRNARLAVVAELLSDDGCCGGPCG